MAGRLAVDFGTSNTVIAVWDEGQKAGVPLLLPEYARLVTYGEAQMPVIPSLIHYAPDHRQWLGNQILQRNLLHSERTFRWMKRYIAHRSPVTARLDGRAISHFEAGRDFLSTVLTFAAAEAGVTEEEVAFTVPVESFEHYEEWLAGVAQQANLPRFRLIDEPSAAALGYGAHIQPGDVYLIFDFGGGTLDVAVVLIEADASGATGQRCRVLGKAGADIGGAILDQWLFEDALRQNGRGDADEDVRPLSRALLVECERAKERLSTQEQAEVSVMNPDTGAVLAAQFTRARFEELLDAHQAFTTVDQTIRRALNASRERGYAEENIKAVLMVGGSSLIPCVQRTLQRIFGREKVLLDRPLDAVARGAAAFVAGINFLDHIQHDYGIRYVNAAGDGYAYHPLVKRGTPYPTPAPVARLTIKATYDGQKQLGLAIFEMGEQRRRSAERPLELVFDPTGAARVTALTPDEEERRSLFWMNEKSPTFLSAEPPARRGEPCFQVEFSIDPNKRLIISARDLRTQRLTHRDFPVVKLS